MQETILVIVAHPPDIVLGAGGTLAKYLQEGKRIHTIIFSSDSKKIKKSIKAGKLIGSPMLTSFGLRNKHFYSDYKSKLIARKLLEIIEEEKPSMVFTHGLSLDIDRLAVHNIIKGFFKLHELKTPLYIFDTFTLVRKQKPRLVVDITHTLGTKIKAALVHRKQNILTSFIASRIFIKSWISGIQHGMKSAEVFYRIR